MWNTLFHPDHEQSGDAWRMAWQHEPSIAFTTLSGTSLTGAYNAYDLQSDSEFSGHIIKKIELYAAMYFPQNFAFIGSNDGTTWTVLHEVSGNSGIDHSMTYLGKMDLGNGLTSHSYKYEATFENTTQYRYVGVVIMSGLLQSYYNDAITSAGSQLGANEMIISGE